MLYKTANINVQKSTRNFDICSFTGVIYVVLNYKFEQVGFCTLISVKFADAYELIGANYFTFISKCMKTSPLCVVDDKYTSCAASHRWFYVRRKTSSIYVHLRHAYCAPHAVTFPSISDSITTCSPCIDR
jgi:hypothetical protein